MGFLREDYVDYTLFTSSKDQAELPFGSCLSLIPDTLDHNCWPRDIRWLPCRYMDNEKFISFFIIKECITPKAGFIPYTDYLILEFYKMVLSNAQGTSIIGMMIRLWQILLCTR